MMTKNMHIPNKAKLLVIKNEKICQRHNFDLIFDMCKKSKYKNRETNLRT